MKNLKFKSNGNIFSAIVALAILLSGSRIFGLDANMVSLKNHVPAIVSKLAPLADLPATNKLRLAIGLPVQNAAGLDALEAQLYDPQSTNFHQYLSRPRNTRFTRLMASYSPPICNRRLSRNVRMSRFLEQV